MSYSAFVSDVLCRGAVFACQWADKCGVSGQQQAVWLARLASKKAGRTPVNQLTLEG